MPVKSASVVSFATAVIRALSTYYRFCFTKGISGSRNQPRHNLGIVGRITVRFATVALFALCGCTSVQVWLGWRVRLDKIQIIPPIVVSLPKGPGIAPGQKSPLVVTITEPSGNVLITEGKGHGKIIWADIKVAVTVVTANSKGVIFLPRDPRFSEGKVPHVVITVPSHPDLRAELDIPIRYDHNFSADFSGRTGSNGSDGSNGTDGSNGASGSNDPEHPSAGGNGSDGSDGSDGQNGEPGENAPAVQVRVTLKATDQPLLQVCVSDAQTEEFFLVNPQGGSLTVHAEGGAGGSGGKGGKGGSGGAGGLGSSNGQNGRDGANGRDGWDGSRGSGGPITVSYDPRAKPFLSTIRFHNDSGPAPTYREETIESLW